MLLYNGPAHVAYLRHVGEGNFIVHFYGADTDFLANEIGNWEGSVPMQAGPTIIEVIADGTWLVR